MNQAQRNTHRRSPLFLVAALLGGCSDSIELFPNDAGTQAGADDGASLAADARGPDGADSGSPTTVADATTVADVTTAEDLARGNASTDTCTLRPSGMEVSRCRRRYHACTIAGLSAAELTFEGCTDAAGGGGNPALSVGRCAEAVAGESGQTCTADLTCTAPASDTCCVVHAECGAGTPLVVAQICVPSCETTPLLPGRTVHDCAEVAAVVAAPDTRDGVASKLPNLVGLPCVGTFECGPESSYGFSVFCGAGRLQFLSLGPSGLGAL